MSDRKDVLVVDDAEFVCEVYARILDIDRYTYDLCTGGPAALERIAQGDRYSIAVIDYIMPGMNGMELAEKLLEVDPGLRIAFVTGALDLSPLKGVEAEILLKPFTPKDVRTLIRRMRRAHAA
jgi:two-component system, cell cycle sensor histidine kinase and response regulator CckA